MTVSARAVTSRTFNSLGNRNYRFFFAGQAVSVTGSWLQSTAQAWLILELTHSPLMLGLLLTVQFLPSLLLQPFGGVVADRWPKRRLLILTQSSFAVTAAILGITDGLHRARVWEVFLVVAVFGVINVVDGPTRQAFVPEMVGKGRLPNAVALNSMVFNGARVVGPAIGGVLIATVGTAVCFDLNAISYLAVIAGLMLMRPAELHPNPRLKGGVTAVLTQLREAVAHVRRTPEVKLVIVLMAIVGTFSFNLTILITAIARTGLHAGAGGFGLLSAALGAGALVGAVGVAYASRATMRGLLIGCAVFGLFLALAGQVAGLVSAMILLALAGGGMIVYSAMSNSVVQTFTTGSLRGRVMSLYLWVFLGTTPLGSLLFGAIEQAWGSRAATALGGSVAVLAAAGGTWWWNRTSRSRRAYSAGLPPAEPSAAPTA
ncbi:MAG TPA: MFS transporter [Candidatus Acidoferrales bacterium]|nr:MFS transporter [Candidatus Acidoferrales bacterium]